MVGYDWPHPLRSAASHQHYAKPGTLVTSKPLLNDKGIRNANTRLKVSIAVAHPPPKREKSMTLVKLHEY